jgi:hypothetical protein
MCRGSLRTLPPAPGGHVVTERTQNDGAPVSPASSSPEPLLSITIPTWNRSAYLRDLIQSVVTQADEHGIASLIEIVISDNASDDDTPTMVAAIRASSSVPIHYHRNDRNIGMVANVLQSYELSSGRFAMFIGDDDLVVPGALPKLLSVIRDYPDAVAYVYENTTITGSVDWNYTSVTPLSAVEAARRFFWYIGNAGLFALRTSAAKDSLARVRANATGSWWPQTELLFASVGSSGVREPMFAVPVPATSSPNHAGNVVYTSWYVWESMINSLYRSARSIEHTAGREISRAAVSHVLAPTRVLRVLGTMLVHAAVLDTPVDIERLRTATSQTLRSATGRAMVPLSLFWLLPRVPRVLRVGLLHLAIVIRWPTAVLPRVRALRERVTRHRQRRDLAAGGTGVGSVHLYTPSDQ